MKSSFFQYFNCSSKEELYKKYVNNDIEVQELTHYFEYLKAKNTQDCIKKENDIVEFLNAYAPEENKLQIVMLNSNGQVRTYKDFNFDNYTLKDIIKETYDSKATRFILTANLPNVSYDKLTIRSNNPLFAMEEIAEKLEDMIGYERVTIQVITSENKIISSNYEDYGNYEPQSTRRNFLSNDNISFSNSTEEYREFINYVAKEELKGLNLLDDREKVKNILIKTYGGLSQEQLGVILYDENNNIKDIVNLFTGRIDSSPIDLRLITGILLKDDIKGIELVHNHPSGSLRPSRKDISLTEASEELSTLLEKRFTDHYIIGKGVFSFKEEGLIENPLRKNSIVKKVAEEVKISNIKKTRKIIKKKEDELEL